MTEGPAAAEKPDGDDVIEISVPFAAMTCPQCEVPREPGPCPECGTEVAAPEADKETAMRRAAFLPLVERLSEIRRGFDQIGEGEISLTPDQFLKAMGETDIYERAGTMAKVGGELTGLDLADPKVVGGGARRIVAAHVDRVAELLKRCQEIGRFRPEAPADELRALAIDSGRFGADLAGALIGAIAAQSFDEARQQSARAQELLSGFPFGEAIEEALEKLEPVAAPDLNRRMALALGIAGDYLDEDGELDLARILTGFASEEEPLAAVASRAERYFAHLIEGEIAGDGSATVLLPALALVAASERPLLTHSSALLLKASLSEAARLDPASTRVLVERTTAQGALIYTALSRVERAVGRLHDDSLAEEAVELLMGAYKNLAETSFRTIGWLAVGLDLIVAGESLPAEDHPPMLGELCQRLTSGGELSRLLATCIDSGLRNAEAHSQYRWVAARQVVKDLRTEQEWSIEQIDEAVAEISACLAGADAGYGCFVIGTGLAGEVPEWLHEDETPIALEMLATLSFSPYGHEVESVEDGGGTVVLSRAASRDPARLIPPLGGLGAFAKAPRFSVRTADGEVLVDVDAADVRGAITAAPVFKDLSILKLAYENGRRAAPDPGRVDGEFAAFAAKVIGVAGLRALGNGDFGPWVLNDLRDRVNWVAQLTKPFASEEVDPAELRRQLDGIRKALTRAAGGRSGSIESLAVRLTRLAEWGEASGYSWPPK